MKRILLVDDDEVYRERLALSLRRRGYEVLTASGAREALGLAAEQQVDAAVIDLKMPGESGLVVVAELAKSQPEAVVLVLTGYGSIASAVEAIRLGASDYMTKPADAEQIEQALRGESCASPAGVRADVEVPSLDRVEWEHLQRVLRDCGGNISQAARVLGIERRSLQRKLQKYPPPR